MSAPELVRLGISALEARLGVHRQTIWRWYKAGQFPEPEFLNDRRTWRLDVIEAWERERLSRPASERRGARNLAGASEAQR